jgi:hypothetical protein
MRPMRVAVPNWGMGQLASEKGTHVSLTSVYSGYILTSSFYFQLPVSAIREKRGDKEPG